MEDQRTQQEEPAIGLRPIEGAVIVTERGPARYWLHCKFRVDGFTATQLDGFAFVVARPDEQTFLATVYMQHHCGYMPLNGRQLDPRQHLLPELHRTLRGFGIRVDEPIGAVEEEVEAAAQHLSPRPAGGLLLIHDSVVFMDDYAGVWCRLRSVDWRHDFVLEMAPDEPWVAMKRKPPASWLATLYGVARPHSGTEPRNASQIDHKIVGLPDDVELPEAGPAFAAVLIRQALQQLQRPVVGELRSTYQP